MSNAVALVGDTSNHLGYVLNSGQDGKFTLGGVEVAVHGAIHHCPFHGNTAITASAVKSTCNGELIVRDGDKAACGATISSPDRGMYVE